VRKTLILKLFEQIQIGFLSPWERGEDRESSGCFKKKTFCAENENKLHNI